MPIVALHVEVPLASFRQSHAREYAQTYPVPPPSTVYGFLLSLVGEVDRYHHCGVKLAIALLSQPDKSTVIRTFRRFKRKALHDIRNAKPDYQELLTNVELAIWVDTYEDLGKPSLCERLCSAFANPASVERFGGLCLGESQDLVDSVSLLPESYGDGWLQWLVKDRDGYLTLPYWADHVGSGGSRWERYVLQESEVWQPPELAWTLIQEG